MTSRSSAANARANIATSSVRITFNGPKPCGWNRTSNRPGKACSVSSVAARAGTLRFADLNWVSGYRAMDAYAQSKLACLMFGLELQRRSLMGV